MSPRRAPLLMSLYLAACGAKTAPDTAVDAAGPPGVPALDALGTTDTRPLDAGRAGDAAVQTTDPDAGAAPTGDARPPATDAIPAPAGDAVVAPAGDAVVAPPADVGAPPADVGPGAPDAAAPCTPAAPCDPACDRDLTNAAWVHLAADPLMDARPEVVSGTLLSDARMPGGVGRRFELALDDGTMRGFVYVIPAPLTLPFVLGETVRFEATGLQEPGIDGHATLSGPEGVRLAVINRRGGEPTTTLGLPLDIEDLGCGPTLVGNCLLAMPATLVVHAAGSPPTIAHTGDTFAFGGWDVHVARVYRDANACEPALHGLYANLLLTRGRP